MRFFVHAAIHPLGYPKAALFGCCLALVASHMLVVVQAAVRRVHDATTLDQDLSLYYVAHESAQTYQGMMSAIPAEAWQVCSSMTVEAMAATLHL